MPGPHASNPPPSAVSKAKKALGSLGLDFLVTFAEVGKGLAGLARRGEGKENTRCCADQIGGVFALLLERK